MIWRTARRSSSCKRKRIELKALEIDQWRGSLASARLARMPPVPSVGSHAVPDLRDHGRHRATAVRCPSDRDGRSGPRAA